MEPKVTGLDHVVILTADAERSLAWYQGVLGLAGERVEEWRRGDVPFPSVRVDATTILDLLNGDRSGVNVDHLCLVIEAQDLATLAASGRLDVVAGPAARFGAQGMGEALYVRDPDGNIVELRHYGA
jgi:catechol 2,3-dioxygenase-like lactoylglutathione lyase family enzyme